MLIRHIVLRVPVASEDAALQYVCLGSVGHDRRSMDTENAALSDCMTVKVNVVTHIICIRHQTAMSPHLNAHIDFSGLASRLGSLYLSISAEQFCLACF